MNTEKLNIKIENIITKQQQLMALKLVNVVFYDSGFDNIEYIKSKLSSKDWKNSILIEVNGDTVGFYLFSINSYQKCSGKGIEGVALGLLEIYRGLGIGKTLISYPYSAFQEYDYLWGKSLKSLNNIEHWLKRRDIIDENESIYITYKRL